MSQSGILSEIADFLSNNSLVVIGFFVISVAANIIQFVSYIEQKRSGGLHKDAIEEWLRINKGKLTQKQNEELQKEKLFLQGIVAKDIPRQAKRVFIEDQVNSLSESISQSYKRYNQLIRELDEDNRNDALPISLQQAIEEYIMPSYLEKQRKQEFIYWGVAASLILTAMPLLSLIFIQYSQRVEVLIFTYRIGWIWQILLCVTLTTFLFHRWLGKSARFENLNPITIIAWWAISLLIFCFISLITSSWAYLKKPPSELLVLLIFILATIPIAYSIFLTLKRIGQIFTRQIQTRRRK